MALYTLLVIGRDYNRNLSHVSYNSIHDFTGWGTQKISGLIKSLGEAGAIEYYSGDSTGRSNLYAFPHETFGKKGQKSELPPPLKQQEHHVQAENKEERTCDSVLSLDELRAGIR